MESKGCIETCPLIILGDDEFDDIPESTGEFQCEFNEFLSNVAQAKQWELHVIMGRPQGESAPLKLSSINEKHDTWLPVDWHTRFMFKLCLVSSCRLCVLWNI